jgi:hypothetical protein
MLVFLETKVEIKGSDRHDRSEEDIARRHETSDIDKQASTTRMCWSSRWWRKSGTQSI